MDSKFGRSWGGWCSIDPLGHMGWGYERILKGGGGCFLVIPDLSRKMAPRSNFGMICGVGRWPLRKRSWSYIALLVRRILLLQFTWISLYRNTTNYGKKKTSLVDPFKQRDVWC